MNPGDRYGRYQIIRQLGRGAMGEVYLANDLESRRQIALKVVYEGPDPEDLEIIEAERLGAELQKRLSGFDRRVVVVNRYAETNGSLFIEMEYIEGEDLSTILARGPVNPGFATHVAAELCEMIQNLGSFTTTIGDRQFAGVVHGDLKPRNIRLNTQNQVKALDFGISKALSHTRRYTMNVFASTAYCSPERLETQTMDGLSDLWSVGVLLYQMLAGRLPFEEQNKERLERRIRSAIPPPALPPDVPEPLSRIAFKMLARDQSARYQTAIEMKEDLDRFRRGEPVLAQAPAPPDPDNEATTRTGPLADLDAEDRTIRTGPLPPPLPMLGPDDATVRTDATFPKAPPIVWPPQYARRNTLGCLIAFGTVFLIFLIFFLVQWDFWNDASKLKADLQTERLTDLDEAWKRYQALANRTHFGVLLWGASNALKKKLVAAADDIILDFRNNDSPGVYEAQWTQANTDLHHALEIDPGDNAVKGRYRLTEGHLDRIAGEKQRGVARLRTLNTAIAKFNESADLLKKSPDPYLGLARLYVYDMPDLDKAEQALNQAAKYGHPIGRRETAQLADGYRRRADRFWRESRGLTSAPDQEKEYLNNAHQDYIHAVTLYDQAGLFGDAPRNKMLALEGQQRVEERLDEITSGDTTKQPKEGDHGAEGFAERAIDILGQIAAGMKSTPNGTFTLTADHYKTIRVKKSDTWSLESDKPYIFKVPAGWECAMSGGAQDHPTGCNDGKTVDDFNRTMPAVHKFAVKCQTGTCAMTFSERPLSKSGTGVK